MARIGIIGGGAFGTAMACVLRRSGHDIRLWAREPEVVASINRESRNPCFLEGIDLLPGIEATNELRAAVRAAQLVLLAPPAQHMRAVTASLREHLKPGTPVVSCSKGIERGSCALMPEVLAQTLPGAPVAVLSGPSFARAIANPHFCIHPTSDVIGVAIGGVMKNVIAIASGIAAGRKLGENARATLVTLGLEEALRLGIAKGARAGTFTGLAGIGDMMLTANSLTSRNTSLGLGLGEGKSLTDILSQRKEVTEGAFSAGAVAALGRKLDIEMPITFALERVLSRGQAVDAAIEQLLAVAGRKR